MSKWNGKFASDVADRCISTAGAATIGVLTATGTDIVTSDPKTWWTLVGIPTLVTLLKSVVLNASTGTEDAPSASFAKVSSNPT